MTTKTTIVVKCDKCGKTNSVEGHKATIGSLWKDSVKKGWSWTSANKQLCPDHAPKRAAKPAKKAPAKKAPAKKAASAKPRKSPAHPRPPRRAIPAAISEISAGMSAREEAAGSEL